MQTLTAKTSGTLKASLSNRKVLMLDDYPAIQSCTYSEWQESSMFLEQNMLLFIVEGSIKIRYGKVEYAVTKDQMAFLKKDILVEFLPCTPSRCPAKVEYILISLKYELIKEFARLAELALPAEEAEPVTVNTLDKRLQNYISSLETYFTEPEKVEGSLIKIKLLELLFCLEGNANGILKQMLDLRENFRSNITATVEENVMNSLSLHQLAVLSGRSLSSFRRDFLAIYNMPPSQWIRQKRLEKAQELLLSTTMTVTDICYTTGFENIAHFSRLFKSQFRYSPSEFRLNVFVA